MEYNSVHIISKYWWWLFVILKIQELKKCWDQIYFNFTTTNWNCVFTTFNFLSMTMTEFLLTHFSAELDFGAVFFLGTATARLPAFWTCRTSTLLRHIASLSSSFLIQAITRLMPFTSWCFASIPSSRKKPTVLQRLANWGTWWTN